MSLQELDTMFRYYVCLSRKSLSLTVPLAIIMVFLLFPSCTGGKKEVGEAITERDSLPMMQTLGVTTFISDSGVTRYKVVTEEWLVFDRKNPSYWAFEKGVYLEQFDSIFSVEASIESDTAYYYDKTKLWKLIGNVNIENRKGEHFSTELLYWDQAKKKVYTDRFIRILQPEQDRIIHAYGFDSNEQLTQYTFRNLDGIFYVDEQDETSSSPAASSTTDVPADTLQTDTIR